MLNSTYIYLLKYPIDAMVYCHDIRNRITLKCVVGAFIGTLCTSAFARARLLLLLK